MTKKLKSGEILWAKTCFQIDCCDCGLAHFFTVDKEVSKKRNKSTLLPNDTWLALRGYRDQDKTDLNRKRRRIKIVKTRRR